MEKWIEIARTGTFADSQGRMQTFTNANLVEIARAFDPKRRDCALCIGHPKGDSAPAFGWATEIKAENGKLFAQFAQVPAKVSEMVKNGHYRHVSMSLMPDRKTLRHVALLGAAQPAIDGLEPLVELGSDSESITINFAMGEAMPEDLQREIGALKERIATLEKENQSLKDVAKGHKEAKDKAEADKKEAQEKEAKTASEYAAYRGQIENEKLTARVGALVKTGKITPAEKPGILEFARELAKQDAIHEFSQADGQKEQITLCEKYLRELEARPEDERQMMFSAKQENSETCNFNPGEMAALL